MRIYTLHIHDHALTVAGCMQPFCVDSAAPNTIWKL